MLNGMNSVLQTRGKKSMDYGSLSLLPSLVAIVLAIRTRRIVASLFIAILVGAALLAFPPDAVSTEVASADYGWRAFGTNSWSFLYRSIIDPDHRKVLAFTVLFGAMVGVLEASGALRDVVRRIARFVRGRRSGQALIGGMGLAIFFDDYANTLLLGGTMRSTCDTFKISRAKLAYLVDSTAAPVAGLALISTWVVTEIGLIGEGLKLAESPPDATAFHVFLTSLPYRFYPILAIVLVAVVAISGRDFGPMRKAEQDAWDAASSVPQTSLAAVSNGWSWLAAILPIVACLTAVVFVMVRTGRASLEGEAVESQSALVYWGEVFGNSDSYAAMIIGGITGLTTALLTGWLVARQATVPRLLGGALRGAWQIMPAMVVLWLAWALSEMTAADYLDTGGYLKIWLQGAFPLWLLPTVVFVVAAGVAFSTGTSWGTMGLLTPLAIQLGLQAAGNDVNDSIFLATAGSVLAGAIFGDHCSPISDTTVLSSRASGCEQVEHVRTQLPYALLAGIVAILCGTIPAAFGLASWLCVLLGLAMLILAVRLLGKPVVEGKNGGIDLAQEL